MSALRGGGAGLPTGFPARSRPAGAAETRWELRLPEPRCRCPGCRGSGLSRSLGAAAAPGGEPGGCGLRLRVEVDVDVFEGWMWECGWVTERRGDFRAPLRAPCVMPAGVSRLCFSLQQVQQGNSFPFPSSRFLCLDCNICKIATF